MTSADQPSLHEAGDPRLPWIEPAVSQLSVGATRYNCGKGGDPAYSTYNTPYADCTKS